MIRTHFLNLIVYQMATKQKTTQQQLGMWIPITILLLGIVTSIFAISRNGKGGFMKMN